MDLQATDSSDIDATDADDGDVASGELVPRDPLSSARAIAGKLDQALRNLTRLTVDDVFAAPTTVGDRVIITAANVRRQGGFGFGAGMTRDGGSDGDDGISFNTTGNGPGGDSGGGGGGGGGADARPVAVISVDATGVHVKPVLDMTKIGLTLLTAGLTIWRTLRKT